MMLAIVGAVMTSADRALLDWPFFPTAYMVYFACPLERSQAIRRSLFIHSSISVLLLKPVISIGSAPGVSAIIFHSPSAIRSGLKMTFCLAMRSHDNHFVLNQGAVHVPMELLTENIPLPH